MNSSRGLHSLAPSTTKHLGRVCSELPGPLLGMVLVAMGLIGIVSQLLPSPVWAFSARSLIRPAGAAAGDRFGFSVSDAGDVNGDGYADVIVGAYLNDAGDADAGRAFVYYGGPGADAVADLTLTGAAAGDNFGFSVSGAGDVNGDGYGDVIVGAIGSDAGGADAGRAFVYYGGPGADTAADLTLTGAAAGDNFGVSASGAGDVNGDGYGDVIVGAYLNDFAGANAGRAYVYYGGLAANAVADLILTGETAGDNFGVSVSGAGDVNGDGYGDVIVGAHANDLGGADAGRAYVYYGGVAAETSPDLTLTGTAAGERFGVSVSGAGDVNGDGNEDVIVGAYFSDVGGTDAGRAYVYCGGSGADIVADLTLAGAAAGDRFGVSVSGAGDVNGDGYGDVVVGAYQNDDGGTDAGRAYAYYGGAVADTVADLTVTGEAGSDLFGFSVSGAGDVNGDGYGDVIVGAYGNDFGGTGAGRAYVYTSRPYEVLSPDGGEQWVVGREHRVRWMGGDPADLWISFDGGAGYSLLASGVGGGEENELALTAPGHETEIAKVRVSASGEAVTHGSSDASDGVFSIVVAHAAPAAAHRLQLAPTGEAAGDFFGDSVSGAGDVNGDGYGDVIVGAWAYNAGGLGPGRAYVYYGGPGADAVADLTLTGEAASDHFGDSVSGAGDVNGDGYGDVIVGAPENNAGGSNAGRAYVYYGGPGADAAADLTLTGEAADDFFGHSVSGAGDVNGDGYGDVIVGVDQNDAGGTDAGRAHVYYGGTGADAVADLTLTGAAAGDFFGDSVSGAGDVNGDGYGDVIVGASVNDAEGVSAGRAYVYYGGLGADAAADLTLTGEAADDFFGHSVSGAGDVNGDGHGDVIVGAWKNDAGGSDAGRAYVYDFNRYFVTTPNGGETWNVGATKTISWLGAEPADVWLSVDGGNTHELVEGGVGGSAANALTIRVPHTPTKFARIRVSTADAAIGGFDRSDSLFTIQTSVALLSLLAAQLPERGGATITWSTDPGPHDLSGYRLERASQGGDWRTLAALTRETSVTDPEGGPGTRYRLYAVNGFGEELWLGETSIRPLAPLAAWPLPYRGGDLTVSFATFGGLGGGRGKTEVSLYDVSGRLVRRIVRGEYGAGHQQARWDGRDDRGRPAAAGIYFLRVSGGPGDERAIKLSVLK